MDTVPGIDVSRWQGQIAWDKVANAGYRFAYIRAAIGDYYTDHRFQENWDGARDAGLLLSAYHVVAPKVDAQAQIAHFLDVLGSRVPDLPVAVDVERADGVSREGITACARACLGAVEAALGCRPIVYSARWFWDRWVLPSPEWRAYDLWVASYTESALLPNGWSEWRFWQYSESGKVPGVSSRGTDLNRFAGSYADLLRYAGERDAQPDDGHQEGADERVRWPRAQVTYRKVNVRSGPATSFDDVGDLLAGDLIEIRNIAGDDAWVEIEPGRWAAFSYKGDRHMELLPDESVDDAGASADAVNDKDAADGQ